MGTWLLVPRKLETMVGESLIGSTKGVARYPPKFGFIRVPPQGVDAFRSA